MVISRFKVTLKSLILLLIHPDDRERERSRGECAQCLVKQEVELYKYNPFKSSSYVPLRCDYLIKLGGGCKSLV